MLNVIHAIACLTILILVYALPSQSYLINNGHRLIIKKITFSNYLKMSDTIEDSIMTKFDKFDNDKFSENQNSAVANELKVGDASPISNPNEDIKKQRRSQFLETSMFLLRAAVVGVATGGSGLSFH